MIKKLVEAKEKDTVVFWGTGKPLRQQLYVDDLVEFVPKLLEQHNTSSPIIISPDENLSISEMINSCLSIINKNINVQFNQALDGQYRKDGANIEFKKLFPNSKFTSFEEGLKKTIKWYLNYEKNV
jgi:nucleoside-diphosphate-sugar epimerase